MAAQDRDAARLAEERARLAMTAALDSGRLPDAARDPARRLLGRLQTPVRVALLGGAGIGRSSLLNLLAGQEIVPTDLVGGRLPTLELTHGERDRTVMTHADGTELERDDIDAIAVAAEGPVLVRMESDLPALRRISLLELVAGGDAATQMRAVLWAAKRADLAIWCTKDFSEAEQKAWAAVPANLHHDSILLRTHADRIREPQAMVRTLERTGGEMFDKVLTIDTPRALAARSAEGGPDRAAFKASGGQALISSVLKMVARNRQLLVDQCDLLLMRHLGTTDPLAIEETQEAPEPTIAPPPTPTPEPVVEAKAPEAEAPAAKPAPVAAATPVAPAPRPVQQPTALSDATRATLVETTDRLAKAGRDLLDQGADAARVMDRSVDEFVWLADRLDAADDPALEQARDCATDAADIVQLMQLEKSDDAATEAVGLMIQMRRTLRQQLAA